MSIIKKIISSTIVATFAFSALILPSKPVYAATPQGLIYQDVANGIAIGDMELQSAWNKTQGSSDVKVAVVDSSVDFNSLTKFCNYNKVPKGYDFENGSFQWLPGDSDHGTAVAQSVLLSCPNATIYAYDTHLEAGKTSKYTSYDTMFVDITNRAIQDDIDIIVISTALGSDNNYSNTLKALKNFKGLVFKSSGNYDMYGNLGGFIDTNSPNEVMSFWYENGLYDNIVIVGGFMGNDMNNSSVLYSRNHVAVAGCEEVAFYSHITNKRTTTGGSSIANPIVAGVAALLWSYYPDATPQQIRTAITDPSCVNTMYGTKVYNKANGRVNAFKAMNYIANNYLPLKDGNRYYIRNKAFSKYLSNNSNNTIVPTTAATSNSKWLVTYLNNGYYHITTPNKSYYFDINNAWDVENNAVKLFVYSGYDSAQTFRIVKDNNGFSSIYPKLSTTRVVNLKTQTSSTTLNTYNNSDTQKWSFILAN